MCQLLPTRVRVTHPSGRGRIGLSREAPVTGSEPYRGGVSLVSVVPRPSSVTWSRATEAALFPARVAVAFGQASIGVAQLVAPDGPARLLYLLSSITAPDRPIGKAVQPGGIVDRILDDNGVLARLSEPGGVLDRLIAEGGVIDRVLKRDGALDRILAPGGLVDRVIEPGGVLDRLLEQEGAIERIIAPGGVLDRLLDREGLLEQLVAEDGIIVRLGDLMETIVRLEPILAGLEPVVGGVQVAASGIERSAGGIDRSAAGLDESARALVELLGPVVDIVERLPGARRRAAVRRPGRAASTETRPGADNLTP